MTNRKLVLASVALPLALATGLAGAVAPGLAASAVQAPQVDRAAAAGEGDFVERMEALYDEIEPEFRPDVRWWLAEGLNTDETLKDNVKEIADSGFGAAEFLAMPEPGAPDEIYGWGSEEWTHDSRLVMEEAIKRGLGFSLTSGTHWATANLPDTWSWQGERFDLDNKASAQELNYSTKLLAGGEAHTGALPKPVLPPQAAAATKMTFQRVVAAKVATARPGSGQAANFAEGTGTGQLDFDSLVDLTDQVVTTGGEPTLSWTAPNDGQYALFTYWMHGTGQLASPSVSKNYTINYVDATGAQALKDYWEAEVLTPDLKELIRSSGRGEMYMDSLEIASYAAGGMLWGYDFLDEFEERRGYDVTKYLPLITWDKVRHDSDKPAVYDYAIADQGDAVTLQKVRFDMAQTFSELYEQNVLKPIQEWLHGLNMKLRAEPSYGYTYEISTPGKYLDGIETETFAQNGDLDLYRSFAGSAHMYGRQLSSETGAVGGRNYFYSQDHWTQIALMQMAGGVNRVVWHGYSGIEGSAADTKWPGHEGMSTTWSERFNNRQPSSSQYPAWNEMLGRNQKVLRQGQPQRDIAILRTDNQFQSYGHPAPNNRPEYSRFLNDKPYHWQNLDLQKNGYTYDYFSPQLLEDEENVTWTADTLQPEGPSYQAVVLYQEYLERGSAERLLEIARGGLPVVFVDNASEFQFTPTLPGAEVKHAKAASRSRSLRIPDAEVSALVEQIKALPNVKTVGDEAEAMPALKTMGVEPRVAYAEPTSKIMTVSRLDKAENVLYTYVHSVKFAEPDTAISQPIDTTPVTYDLSFDAQGKPYSIDDASGDVAELGEYAVADGRTDLQLTLKPGEARIVALDLSDPGDGLHAVDTTADEVRSSNGRIEIVADETGQYSTTLSNGATATNQVTVPATVDLPTWDLTIEDWNEGERVETTEEKFGHTTTEVFYTTKKTPLKFPNTALKPWKDLTPTQRHLKSLGGTDPKMSDVSGTGTYTTSFDLPADWDSDSTGATFSVDSTNGGSSEVFVNGERAPFLDLRALEVDISDLVKPGRNTIKVTTSTSLTNRMLKRGYRPERTPQAYGLSGEARITPYTVAKVTDQADAVASRVTAATASGVYGKTVAVNVQVTSPRSTSGYVAIRTARGVELDTARVVDGRAALSVPTTALGAGNHHLVVSFEGNAQSLPATSSARVQVAKAASALRVTVAPKQVKAKKRARATVRVTVNGAQATGKVVARINGKTVGSGVLKAGKVTIKLRKVRAGAHRVRFTYAGNADIKASNAVVRLRVRR